jgi:L-rhamnose isomerase
MVVSTLSGEISGGIVMSGNRTGTSSEKASLRSELMSEVRPTPSSNINFRIT